MLSSWFFLSYFIFIVTIVRNKIEILLYGCAHLKCGFLQSCKVDRHQDGSTNHSRLRLNHTRVHVGFVMDKVIIG